MPMHAPEVLPANPLPPLFCRSIQTPGYCTTSEQSVQQQGRKPFAVMLSIPELLGGPLSTTNV